MPPFIARKRWRSNSPPPSPKPKKPSLFDVADRHDAKSSIQDNKAFLERLNGSDSDTTLSDVSSSEFEDVIGPSSSKKRKTEHEDEEEIDWEDAIQEEAIPTPKAAPEPSGDLVLNLGGHAPIDNSIKSDKKKGPSKIERQIRTTTHCMHVQFLLFHNLIRNGWACDKEVQTTLVSQLPPGVKKEVEKWKTASGMEAQSTEEPLNSSRQRFKRRNKDGKVTEDIRSQREWGKPAERQEKGAPNMSSADPVIRLLKVLAAYWKKRFTVTAPGLRKQGYKTLAQLEEEISSFRNDKHDLEQYGERIDNVEGFRICAKNCEGSRDVGVQLFTALIRGLGIEARLVASLQPVGFGWIKNEEASLRKRKKASATFDTTESSINPSSDEESSVESIRSSKTVKNKAKRKILGKGQQDTPLDVSDGKKMETPDSDDESVIDITPSIPKKKPNMHYDRDLAFPTYWIEVVSPITHEVYPVDPFILNPAVATNGEHLAAFESRGAKADKAKQVFAYIVAYSSDGSAKEVTTRYLKRHMWPGRTKGVRMPVAKVPVYNKRGKIKYHEDYDWFKTVMSGYKRPHHKRTVVDDLEDAENLKAVKSEKPEKKEGEDTLQGYKSSAEYVLERHLRREEAILPGAEPVKTFITGKGDKAKEEPVFLRKDVTVCRTGESWHKEGRQIKFGETPMKMVPVRAVTLTRKREVEEAQRDGGEKLKQGLYSWDQTDWIIPPPIENGVIPKNAFGNMDCYVPTMVPKGAVHIPLRSTMKICKRLGIDYAEAVTGFEFGKQRAVPVITGVVVAAEHEDLVINEWEKDEEERRRKEDQKREKAALAAWRKMVMGLRIFERVRNEYGDDGVDLNAKEESNPFTRKAKDANGEASRPVDEDTAGGFVIDAADWEDGGFLPEGYPDENDAGSAAAEGGGFLPDADDGPSSPEEGRGRLINGSLQTTDQAPLQLRSPTPDTVATITAKPIEEQEHKSSSLPPSPPPKKRGRPSKATATPTPNPKPSNTPKSTPKRTAKAPSNNIHTLSSPPASFLDGSIDSPPVSSRPTPRSKTQAKTPGRTVATRSTARKRIGETKSPYFEGSSESESEDDEASSEAEAEFKPDKS